MQVTPHRRGACFIIQYCSRQIKDIFGLLSASFSCLQDCSVQAAISRTNLCIKLLYSTVQYSTQTIVQYSTDDITGNAAMASVPA